MPKMLTLQVITLYFSIFPADIFCIWPPSYKINLKYEEEFVISELLQKSDVEDVYEEEEMIREEDLKTLNLHENADKYYRLHKQAKGINKKIENINSAGSYNIQLTQSSLNQVANKASIGGNAREDDSLYYDYDAQYLDDERRSNETNSQKLEKRFANDTVESNYDYDSLKVQYEDSVNKAENKKDTAKYKEVKEEESPAEAAKSLVTFERRNCTEEEKKGFGIATLQCFWIELQNKTPNKNKQTYIVKKLSVILLIWLTVYILIALPLWCQYGWCCCCCRCTFCHPREQIEEIKTFFFNNPPGIHHDEKGNLIKYQLTQYERYAQKNLQKAIERL